MMAISYHTNYQVTARAVAKLFIISGIRRPADDLDRIQQMLNNANLTVTAWDGERLVGIGRALTDYRFCCYLSDLAVDAKYQHQGIGKEIVKHINNTLGDEVMLLLLLLAAPEAIDYYPHIGFDAANNAWIVPRGE